MKAVFIDAPGRVRVGDAPYPRLHEGWVIIESRAVGICGTDKAFYRGSYPLFKQPLIPGHEVSGIVVEGPDEIIGRSVVSEINFACLKCEVCKRGLYTHCPRRRTLGIDFDGGMAEYFTAPLWAIHAHRLPHERAFAAEPLAAVLHAIDDTPPGPGDLVAILGTGFIAYLIAAVLERHGFRPVVVGREGSLKAERLRKMGFRVVGYEEALEIGRTESWSGLGYDLVFEATGSNNGLKHAIALARPRGTVHLKSTPGGDATLDQTLAVVKEVRIHTSRCGVSSHFRSAIQLLGDSEFHVPVDGVYPLDRAPEAFDESLKPESMKILVKPGE